MKQNYEISCEQVIVHTEIPILTLLDLEITHQVNEHARLVLSAILQEEKGIEILHTDWTDSRVIVLKKDEPEPAMFCGRIEKLTISKENRLWKMQMTVISETKVLDRVKRSRSFQNIERTYIQIAKEVMEIYQDMDYNWNADKVCRLGQPVIQYQETDWQFLKRLCSHFHGVLLPDFGQESFSFGMGKGKERNLEHAKIIEQGFDSNYYRNGSYESGLPADEAFYLKIMTKENWQMGDWIPWGGKRYQVYNRSIVYRNGELLIFCHLGTEGTFYQKKLYNEALAGLRLEGTVKKTEEENVYLQLDIDQKEGADYPWPWTPETNNLCYCMPELGTKAVLYLGTQEERDARAVLAEKRIGYIGLQDLQNKWIRTNYHHFFGLLPKHIIAETSEINMISMSDRFGIGIYSSEELLCIADGRLLVEGKHITVISPDAIAFKTQTSNIEICRDFNFYAPKRVRTIGTGIFHNKKETENESEKRAKKQMKNISHWQASYAAVAAVPTVDFSKLDNPEAAVDLLACGSVPKVVKGSTTIALTEVMGGKKESDCSYPRALRSMENYVVKGGYALPEEKD